ncbi:hypothetical protein [Streptomyces sp. NPDC001903]|uniref:hypothetical protein n=1 Tax=Streptomyces sp. NPDC001903 TaxID=3364622 RepID=UPI0036BE8DF1
MKLGHVIAATVLLTPIPFAGMTNPAAAFSPHTVVVSGLLRVEDSGSTFSIPPNKRHLVNLNIPPTKFTLTHTRPTHRAVHKACAAEETQGQLTISLVLQPSERVDALAELKLFEESHCENYDLDGTDWASVSVPPGQTGRIENLFVTNSQEYDSWDNASASVTIDHWFKVNRLKKICPNKQAC